ncbi:hypothetical protein M404DRAFT_1000443 [Pisolithus tinctorius Marx 270]|uniref:Uncharacterized protein n=1 Tax=Pisolithus tinctorius Marx 270 TaxID=870435 RepID=A0A0C3P9P3_PISTI|nr:hypothetical protein M404DRAFT_1000443 [Pisolithus tinctorius Marx 270]
MALACQSLGTDLEQSRKDTADPHGLLHRIYQKNVHLHLSTSLSIVACKVLTEPLG